MIRAHTYYNQEQKKVFQLSFVEDDDQSLTNFKELVQRALNTWCDAHPELKELGDMLMHGRILQDYYASRSDLKRKS